MGTKKEKRKKITYKKINFIIHLYKYLMLIKDQINKFSLIWQFCRLEKQKKKKKKRGRASEKEDYTINII